MKMNLDTMPNNQLFRLQRKLSKRVAHLHRRVVFWTKALQIVATAKPESLLDLLGEVARTRRHRVIIQSERARISLNAVSRTIRQRKMKGTA